MAAGIGSEGRIRMGSSNSDATSQLSGAFQGDGAGASTENLDPVPGHCPCEEGGDRHNLPPLSPVSSPLSPGEVLQPLCGAPQVLTPMQMSPGPGPGKMDPAPTQGFQPPDLTGDVRVPIFCS